MRLPSILFTGLAISTNAIFAQDISSWLEQLPECVQPCFQQSINNNNCTTASCICTSSPFQIQLLSCLETSCNIADQLRVTDLESVLCANIPVPSRNGEIQRGIIILAAITYPIVMLRYYQRWTIAHQVWMDDWMALVAVIFLGAYDGVVITSVHKGFGDHIWVINPNNRPAMLTLFWLIALLYTPVQVFVKLSICCLYLRIFPLPFFQRLTKGVMLFIAAHLFSMTFVVIFQCTPINAAWDSSIEGKCISMEAGSYANAAINIFEDLLILLLPIPELNSLSLGTRKKVALALVFSLGSFACITSIIRLKYLVTIGRTDLPWNNTDPLIWSNIEAHTALICASLPPLKSLLTKYFPALFKSTLASASNPKNNNLTISQKVLNIHHTRRRQSDSYVWLPESTGASRSNISAGGAAALGVVGDEEKDIPLRVIERDGHERASGAGGEER